MIVYRRRACGEAERLFSTGKFFFNQYMTQTNSFNLSPASKLWYLRNLNKTNMSHFNQLCETRSTRNAFLPSWPPKYSLSHKKTTQTRRYEQPPQTHTYKNTLLWLCTITRMCSQQKFIVNSARKRRSKAMREKTNRCSSATIFAPFSKSGLLGFPWTVLYIVSTTYIRLERRFSVASQLYKYVKTTLI